MAIFVILAVLFFVLWLRARKKGAASSALTSELSEVRARNEAQASEISELNEKLINEMARARALSKYQGLVDVEAEIQLLRTAAEAENEAARALAKTELDTAKQAAKEIRAKAAAAAEQAEREVSKKLAAADTEAKRLVSDAEARAKEIAGDAYEIAGKAKDLEKAAAAMKNVVEGYGDQYLKPAYSLLDELAEDFSYDEAGRMLKLARENTERMVKAGTAATCDYVEAGRRQNAIAFVVDAFNGKVDSILSKTKQDNYGTLEQKIKDAYELVNYNGRGFRNAVITPEYLSARLEELKWGVRASELKTQAQEEQRRIREQIREEEKARREYERAMKEAAKEEEMLRKAMEKAQKQIETATEAKRAEYEAKLEDLRIKLQEAEARGQRALSMAQQTKHGNVYIISNVGSFGENVYKVGMTRRLDPLDRIKELSDASVPFPFDVHAVIESDDAPGLENDLHKALALTQMNKVNPRKEFFRVSIADIKALVENRGLNTVWTMAAEAAEYRETLAIEEAMSNDPEAKKRWEAFAASVTSANL